MIVFARNLVAKDFWLKALSLALAILIWLTVRFSINGEISTSPWVALLGKTGDETVLTIPVRVPVDSAQTVTVDPAVVQVTLRGDPKLLKDLLSDDIRAQVDLTGVQTADGLTRPVEIILPNGIAYTHLAPKEVSVRMVPKIK